MKVKSRLPEVGTTIFAVMSKMAQEAGAINLSQGFPDFEVDASLIARVEAHMKAGHNQYAPMPGLPALRQAIAHVVEQTYARPTDPEDEVTITAGGTQALYTAIAAFVRPGDEVVIFDPAYDSYAPAVRLHGGIPVHVRLAPPHFSIDWNEVKSVLTPRTRMILVNTPHNPTGAVLSAEDSLALERLACAYDLLVLSDEVYERLIFDKKRHQSVLAVPGLADRSIAVFSFGKTFHATGWKVGYAVAAPALMREFRKAHQFIVFSVNTPFQYALAEHLQEPGHYESLGIFYQRKRDFFLDQIKGSSLRPLPCAGSYFQLVQYDDDRPDREMAAYLTHTHKVAPIPVSAFYRDGTDHKLLRFCFAKRDETLQAAGQILRKL